MLAVLDDVRLAWSPRPVDAALVGRQRPEDGHAAALHRDPHPLIGVVALVADEPDGTAFVWEQALLVCAGKDGDTAVLRRRVVQRQPERQVRRRIDWCVSVI